MKLIKILTCAAAAGAMTLASSQAQSVVIDNELYTPLNIKGTFSYVASAGVIKQATFTTKTILFTYFNYDKGTILAVGPANGIYAINPKTKTVIDNLTDEGYFYFENSDTIDTDITKNGTYYYSEAGVATLDFYSDADVFADNDWAFETTGAYTFSETESADNSHDYYKKSVKFSAKNFSGYGYDFDVSDSELPVSGSGAGNASGSLLD